MVGDEVFGWKVSVLAAMMPFDKVREEDKKDLGVVRKTSVSREYKKLCIDINTV